MSDEPKAHGFSEFHQQHIRTTFQYIDKLLSEAEHSMAGAGSPSLFRMHSDDTTPIPAQGDSAGLTQDDLVVIQALYQAGANAMILISKADLFSVTGRERMIEYVKTNLRIQLQVEASVHAVSVLGADAALCDCWFESELRPFLAQHHELAIASQKRKIGGLREAVIGALERRLHAGSEGISIEQAPQPSETIEALRNGDRILERAQSEAFFLRAR